MILTHKIRHHRCSFPHRSATRPFARDTLISLRIYRRESDGNQYGSRAADCPTFVTGSGPGHARFPVHSNGPDRQSLSQNASTVLRLHRHFKQLFINIPYGRLSHCMLNGHLSLWALATWRELYTGCLKKMVQFQKLTTNLFLTLHGQNVHRQQRQLSKFFMH
jgi:hypothetical protein